MVRLQEEPKHEVDRIMDHYVNVENEEPTVEFYVAWRFWPVATASFVKFNDIVVSAEETLKTYLAEKGIQEIPATEIELAALLAQTSMMMQPTEDDSIELKGIVGHRKQDDDVIFNTIWSNGEQIERPRRAFTYENEKEMLKEYVAENDDARRRYKKKTSILGSATRPAAVKSGAASENGSHISDSESRDGSEDVDEVKKNKKRGPKRRKMMVGRLAKNLGLKRPVGRPRKNGGLPLASAGQAIRSFFKATNGDEMTTIEDEHGEFHTRKIDEVFAEKPELVYAALKSDVFSMMKR